MTVLTAAQTETPRSSDLQGRIPAARAAAARLLAWRSIPGFGRTERVVLAVYTALLAWGIAVHEPWADEAQAWMIARDQTFWQMFRYRMHYEGSPALWHVLLRLLHLAHLPWTAIPWCGGAIAVAGVYVMLRWSPFPLLVRVLMPFTFFLLYQYAVVTRSYVLFPLLIFAVCALYTRKWQVVWFAVAAGLLANLCTQGAMVSGVIVLLYGWDHVRERMRMGVVPVPRNLLLRAAAVTVAFFALAIATALPAPDVGFAVQGKVSTGGVHKVLEKVIGETPQFSQPPEPDVIYGMPPPPLPPKPSFRRSPKAWLIWQLDVPFALNTLGVIPSSIAYTLVELASEFIWPVASSGVLAGLFLLGLVLWAYVRRGLRYLLPALALLLLGEFLWTTDHHAGMLLVTLFGGMWLIGQQEEWSTVRLGERRLFQRVNLRRLHIPMRLPVSASDVFTVIAALVLALQLPWTASALIRGSREAYDPGKEAARLLHTYPSTARVATFGYWQEAMQPYFPRNPFFNLPSSYWQWTTSIWTDADHRRTLDTYPDVVVYTAEDQLPGAMRNDLLPLTLPFLAGGIDPVLADIASHGYTETHRLCGERFSQLDASYRVCYRIFEPGVPEVAIR